MKNVLLLIFAITLAHTLPAQTKKEKKKEKEENELKAYEATKMLIESGVYIIESDWATSHGGRRINLIGNPNFIKIDKGEADIFLPFFGRSYSGSVAYGGDSGISFKGTVENYTIDYNDKKQKLTIKFTGKAKSDVYSFQIGIFKSGNASINVTSNNRSTMRYDGKVDESDQSQ